MRRAVIFSMLVSMIVFVGVVFAADIVPTEIKQPGTQPQEVSNLESPDKCDNCHGGYDVTVEPAYNWRGSMMANAGRDPIFWATLAVAEQDFDGAGDLCIRCHSTAGWLGGRSTPTDGSGLAAGDSDGVECDFCHKITNPDNSEFIGVMNPPFIANEGPGNGYYGSGMASIWGGSEKLGPYSDAEARHQFNQSNFHRSVDFCGTCHDVSNPAVGDLAHNNGAQSTAGPVNSDGVLGSPVDGKAAFNNFPFQYGIVERTFSEYKSGSLSNTLVSAYSTLPADLQAGAIKAAYDSAVATNPNGPNYEDGTPRNFSCQTCHLRPVTGFGCNKKGAPVRTDLPLHDMTGGNYWMPDAIQYLDGQGKLLLGGGLTAVQTAALNDGKIRVMKQLNEAASLTITGPGAGDTLIITNLTGHKLISGYPEGRRMWVNIKWYDTDNNLLREDGGYGPIGVAAQHPFDSTFYEVESLIDLNGTNTKIYEAHHAMTKEWADQLISLGYPESLALSFDRSTGSIDSTLGDLAGSPAGSYHETFHFVLNNKVSKDNRIPPYGMQYDEARIRNALPVPADQYGNPSPGGEYLYYDELALNPPAGAAYATIDLLYQTTSWEYIQFLWKANNKQNTFLADEGTNLLATWLSTGMASPVIMVSTTWGSAPVPPTPGMSVTSLTTWTVSKQGDLVAESSVFKPRDTVGIRTIVQDETFQYLSGAQVFLEIKDQGDNIVASIQGFADENGVADLAWKTSRREAPGLYTVNVVDVIKSGFQYVSTDISVEFTIQ